VLVSRLVFVRAMGDEKEILFMWCMREGLEIKLSAHESGEARGRFVRNRLYDGNQLKRAAPLSSQ
jgi:hypothetical protein